MGLQKHFKAFHDTIKLGRKDDSYASAREKDDSIKDAIKRSFNENGFPVIDDFIQGSLAVHTGIKSRDTDFDIDRAIVIDSADAPEDPLEPKRRIKAVLENRGFGFYPVTADIPKKRHTVPKECSCPDAENIAQSSNAKPSP